MPRRLLATAALAIVGLIPTSVLSAQAQERSATRVIDFTAAATMLGATANASAAIVPAPMLRHAQPAATSALYSLYATTAIMQALDVRSTLTAFQSGAVEGNPLMSQITKSRAGFVAMKAGIAASTILSAHQMAKHNKVAAIVTLVAVNSAYAVIVSHNYKVAQSLR
jgi:hypothetical protein